MTDHTKLYLYWKNGVYAGLALSVTLKSEGEQGQNGAELAFFDTNRARIFRGKLNREHTAGLSFITEDADTIELHQATIATYDKTARPKVEGNVPVFRYEQDLHEWYRRRFMR